MRLAIYIFIFMFSVPLASVRAGSGSELLKHWSVTNSSSLQIHGTTNINSFVCESDYSHGQNDMIMERWDPKNNNWEIFGEVLLEVAAFDCKNRVMNNDFQRTLQADEYPEIKVEFLNLKEVSADESKQKAKGWVKISLAGKSKKYPIESELIHFDNYYSVLRGEQVFRFSDFGLEAPSKGLGLVRVRDELSVSFELMLRQIALSGN